ncbi:H-NS family nucleoid-associated regulatory protein [Paraburkholderia sp. RL17-337-BIB-A]|uniref:H-NS family nucleoid-associated regulatory protein n=1 Tax=Paraburkholderia sp. RL17-337-BIB-A TaxID=3031636 RepID=UPI0038BBC50D
MKTTVDTKGKLPPRYINPKTGETWSGHARPPAWSRDVKDRSKFPIADGAEAAVATTADIASKAKTAIKTAASKSVGTTGGKGQRKGPQPAMYRDPSQVRHGAGTGVPRRGLLVPRTGQSF